MKFKFHALFNKAIIYIYMYELKNDYFKDVAFLIIFIFNILGIVLQESGKQMFKKLITYF